MKPNHVSKRALAAAIGALFAGSMLAPAAKAVHLSQDGNFEAGIVNYYTVRNGWTTAFSITNTSDSTVAVKVRVNEGYNTRDVLDFVVILSEYDVWQAWLAEDLSGTPRIYTNDNSCTVPAIPASGQPLLTGAFTGDAADVDPEQSEIPLTIERTKEGHIGVVLMGFANDDEEADDALGPMAVHNSDGEPADCAGLVDAFSGLDKSDLDALQDDSTGFGWHSGDASLQNPLTGQWSLTNPTTGNVTAGGRMVGLADFDSYGFGGVGGGLATLQQNPEAIAAQGSGWASDEEIFQGSFLSPTLASASTNGKVLLDSGDVAVYTNTDGEDGANAVTFAMARASMYNQWTSRPSSGAVWDWDTSTDLTATFATKRFYVDAGNGNGPDNTDDENIYAGRYEYIVGLPDSVGGEPVPFSEYWDNTSGFSCDLVGLSIYDREEQGRDGSTAPFSPSPFIGTSLCTETNVINFGNRSTFESALLSTIPQADLPGTGGTARVTFRNAGALTGDIVYPDTVTGVSLRGLPVAGDAFMQRLTTDGISTSANDVYSVPHVYTREVIQP